MLDARQFKPSLDRCEIIDKTELRIYVKLRTECFIQNAVFMLISSQGNLKRKLNRRKMMRNHLNIGLMLLMISGCGEIAYKQGASAKDYEATKKVCKSAGDDSAVEKCLKDKGWAVQNLGTIGLPDSELFATASVSDDNRNPGKMLKDTENNKPLDNDESTDVTQTENARSITNTKVVKVSDENPQPATPQSKQTTTQISSPNRVPAKPPVNPYEQYKINSWWKMGAGREALESSMAACTTQLGESHQPDRKTQTFTRAFAACMYDKGWRGLRENKR